MKFEFATVEVKKFDLEDILTASGEPVEDPSEAPAPSSELCNTNNMLPCNRD